MKMERVWEELCGKNCLTGQMSQVSAGHVQPSKEKSFIRPCTEPSDNNPLRRFAASWIYYKKP